MTKTWAEWLSTELKRRNWKQAQLVAESGGDIKADRVSKWVNGRERPSHKFAVMTANVLGADRNEALRAAGYDDLPSDVASVPTDVRVDASTVSPEPDPRLVEVSDEDLLRELLRRAEGRRATASNVTPLRPRGGNVGGAAQDELDAVARAADPEPDEDQ